MDKLSLFSDGFTYRFGRLKNRVSKSNFPYSSEGEVIGRDLKSGIVKGISSFESDT